MFHDFTFKYPNFYACSTISSKCCRFTVINISALRLVQTGPFPWAVLAANVLATALLAWCAVAGADQWGRTSPMWFFMTVGVCGGFSTFSTFAWDTLRLWENGGWPLAVANVAVSVVGCVAVSWWVARAYAST